MKILHISTYDSGGAGKAALRSHFALLKAGVDSKFLCLVSNHRNQEQVYIHERFTPKITQRIAHKLNIDLTSGYKQIRINELCSANNLQIFSLPTSDYNLAAHELVEWADIVHIHWIVGFIDYSRFFHLVKKPIVWTLHDRNPTQGGLHYGGELQLLPPKLRELNTKIQDTKCKALNSIESLAIISPSQWLLQLSSESKTFHSRPHYHIANTIDLDIFKPLDRIYCRNVLNLPTEKRIILFVCESLNNPWKGFSLLTQALSLLSRLDNILLLTIGSGNLPLSLPFEHRSFGTIDNEYLMAVLYSAADAFLTTTLDDNLPNVMLESLACGTPVLGTPIGGVQETIIPNETGLLSLDTSPRGIMEMIESFLHSHQQFDRASIRSFAESKFNASDHSNRLVQVYQSLLERQT